MTSRGRASLRRSTGWSAPSLLISILLLTFLLLLSPVTVPAAAATAEAEGDDTVRVEFEVQLARDSTGKFVVEVHPSWAPLGAERFLELVDSGDAFWKGIRFFRVISGFMAQFGIPGKPEVAAQWKEKVIKDDPVKESNKRGYVSFATSGKDSRTTQMFINLVDNTNLDGMGFSPFARVVEGMEDVVDSIYSGYGEGAPSGKGPEQGKIQSMGNKYLKRNFPMLSYVKSVRRIVGGSGDIGQKSGESGGEEL
uniref:Peptidyl-prolyl cis-trans isomerase n=1 Tax=Pseudictyota dubia TaxID=2749911 RepID=A0A7R9Z8S9_9STRA|mmetsp:Transcript_31670/g.58368  ORF Transcript_31670/g.58368 Transcript_31670/m.58368 type:complete len:252 (+) Transcript_31670:25-780(+)|eukprot:CAMPEP_0197436040 /NCGR_PEP_ID=MMETSP1175-20131217/3516_1 /TAXON_ID=1003142 /ORGANISM="Triceratium dubium, Strain CCMP147" /LENGTH=251 /DNA_ID=CAMNT_0042965219 /DNA_START=13 /DNA_END=768 /DNA_ORIENTATION=-